MFCKKHPSKKGCVKSSTKTWKGWVHLKEIDSQTNSHRKSDCIWKKRGMVTPSQSDLKEMVWNQVEKELEWHLYK